MSGLAVGLAAFASADLAAADVERGFARVRLEELTARELAQGVDSDQELQKLMLIERAYAANARVVETADQMIRRLMEI
jgi:flagellar hook-associated protein 1 FlgK